MVAPTSLSLVTSIFEQGRARDRAVSAYSAMAALGAIRGGPWRGHHPTAELALGDGRRAPDRAAGDPAHHFGGGRAPRARAASVVWAVGKVLADVAITITATSGVGEDHKGLAAGLVTTSQEVGRAMGLGVITAVASARTGALGGAQGDLAPLLAGFRLGLRTGVAFLGAALLVVLVRPPSRRREPGAVW